MKIMMISCSVLPFHNSGVAQVVHHTTKELIKRGHKVYVVSASENPIKTSESLKISCYEGYEVYNLKVSTYQPMKEVLTEANYKNPEVDKQLVLCLDAIKPDIVHFHSIQGIGAGGLTVARQMGYTTVVTMHDWWWFCPYSFLADSECECCHQVRIDREKCKKCLEKECTSKEANTFLERRSDYLLERLEKDADKILVVSRYLKDYTDQNIPSITDIEVNLNGVEPPNVLERQESITNTRLGFLGGGHKLKGYELLKEASQYMTSTSCEIHIYNVPQVNRQGLKKVWGYLSVLDIKGLTKKLKQVANLKLQKSKNIPIYRHPPFGSAQKEEVFNQIDILLSLSVVKESSSLVVREALIRGIPVLTTPSGGPLEVVRDGENGEILDTLSPKEVAERIGKMVKDDYYKKLREKMKQAPYEYTYKEQVTHLEEIYQKLLKGR